MSTAATNSFIQTFSGRKFELENPKPNMVDIVDIAHHLSHLCRFAGAVTKFYSVAEHSFRAYRFAKDVTLDRNTRLAVLLHDAVEAYLVDVPTPVKRLLPEYQALEERVAAVIAQHFGLQPEDFHSDTVKLADSTMLATEKRDLLADSDIPWIALPPALKRHIAPQSSFEAKRMFLNYFTEAVQL